MGVRKREYDLVSPGWSAGGLLEEETPTATPQERGARGRGEEPPRWMKLCVCKSMAEEGLWIFSENYGGGGLAASWLEIR